MSTCYILPMSHEWPSCRESSEPISPTSMAAETKGLPSRHYGASTPETSSTTHAAFSNIAWPSSFSLAHSHGLPSSSSHAAVDTRPCPTSQSPEASLQEHVTRENSPGRSTHPNDLTLAAGSYVQKEEDDDGLSGSDLDEVPEDEAAYQTAAERRAAKRKMKRFRLTHNQTRFLLSEFARQPHPDAAQRERLSREIPGLSSRQVQVWFQNRRAKLKRLSVDDRERMMRSRALPEDFDRSSALHAGLPPTPPIGTALSTAYGSLGTGNLPGDLLRYGHIRRPSDDPATSPGSNPSESLWTSGSMPGSEMQSPVSPVLERGHVWGSIAPHIPSPQSNNPYGRSHSFSAIYQAQPQCMRQYSQENLARVRTTAAVSLGQAPPPTGYGRACPHATYEYSRPNQMGLQVQQQGGYPEAEPFLSPQVRNESNPGQPIETSPVFAYQSTFALPPSPNILQHPQPQSRDSYHSNHVLQQASPQVPLQEFTRPALPDQHLRPSYPAYPTDYHSQYTYQTPSPQAINHEEVPYLMSRASISGPPTQHDYAPEVNGAQRQRLRVDTGRRRSFTHPPDHNLLR